MIKIKFSGFWPDFNYKDIEFFKNLEIEGALEIDNQSENPDVIIYSDYIPDCDVQIDQARILFSPENIARKNYLFKYTMNYQRNLENNFRFQNFFYYPFYREVTENTESAFYLSLKNKIKNKHINFIYSNNNAKVRNSYFEYLSKFYKIDSFGKFKNNMGTTGEDRNLSHYKRSIKKATIISDYKFTIAFENSRGEDYISEKVWEPLSVNSIPIYYGSDAVFDYFNKEKIIYVQGRSDFKKSIQLMEEIIKNHELYSYYLKLSIFRDEETRIRYQYSRLSQEFINFLVKVIGDKEKIGNQKIKKIKYYIDKLQKRLF